MPICLEQRLSDLEHFTTTKGLKQDRSLQFNRPSNLKSSSVNLDCLVFQLLIVMLAKTVLQKDHLMH